MYAKRVSTNRHGNVLRSRALTARSRAFANIEYSNYRLSISFPTGLPTISACRCSASSLFLRPRSTLARWFFFPAPSAFFSRAPVFTRCIHFRGPQKATSVAFQFAQPRYFFDLLLPRVNNHRYASVHIEVSKLVVCRVANVGNYRSK